jgi:hypothetical protein
MATEPKAGLLSDDEIPFLRADFAAFLNHSCTLTPMVPGSEDDHGVTTPVPGASQTETPCLYTTIQRVSHDESGRVLVLVPAVMFHADQAVAVGDQVSQIADQLGVVFHPGPFRVERLLDDTAGLGASLIPTWELRVAEAVS